MAILGTFSTTMKPKQSMVILVNFKDNYDTTTTSANKSTGFDLSAIQSCFTTKQSIAKVPVVHKFHGFTNFSM